jgi:hypothetical protein
MIKMNNSIILRIVIIVGSLIFAVGSFYVLTNFRLDAVETSAVKAEEKVEDIDAKMDMIEDTVLIMQYDLRYIKNELIEQKEISKQILMELTK